MRLVRIKAVVREGVVKGEKFRFTPIAPISGRAAILLKSCAQQCERSHTHTYNMEIKEGNVSRHTSYSTENIHQTNHQLAHTEMGKHVFLDVVHIEIIPDYCDVKKTKDVETNFLHFKILIALLHSV